MKGVIRDRNEAQAMERDQQSREIDEVQQRMEKSNLGGKTFLEEERVKAALGIEGRVDPLVMKELEAAEDWRQDMFGRNQEGRRFGHLREVGLKGFVAAVEEKSVWVVVHIYEPVNITLISFSLLAYPFILHTVLGTMLCCRRHIGSFGPCLP